MKNLLRSVVLTVALLAPVTAHAFGLSLSGGAGVITDGGDAKVAIELLPFFELPLIRFEVGIEEQFLPHNAWAIRPGVKAFIPVTGLYLRGGVAWGELGNSHEDSASLILGLGWEMGLLDTLAVYVEATGEPRLYPTGSITYMGRGGVVLSF